VVVIVPGQSEPWQVANDAFRQLVDEARELQPAAGDLRAILQAQALQILDLTSMAADSRQRMAELLGESARRLRNSVLAQANIDLWDRELVDALAVLQMLMEGLIDGEGASNAGHE
jgi:hypothetical protein